MTIFRFYCDITLMHHRKILCQWQTKACTRMLAMIVNLIERFKNLVLIIFFDARAIISNADIKFRRLWPESDLYFLISKFYCIWQQITEHLIECFLIEIAEHSLFWHFHVQAEFMHICKLFIATADGINFLRYIAGLEVQPNLMSFHLTEVQELID